MKRKIHSHLFNPRFPSQIKHYISPILPYEVLQLLYDPVEGLILLLLNNFLLPILFIGILFFLYRWSKELEDRSFTIFIYFLVSTYIGPLFSTSTEDGGDFTLWFPMGFAMVMIYLYASKRYHPAKMKASSLGLCVAIVKIIHEYQFFM
ncbi:hypothetical protein [Robertmurraya korlensis]|uniref:hypothetical protein n=1 Tax=Robertmurraya korlensis TaxID=519977 RepID=UPI000AB99266